MGKSNEYQKLINTTRWVKLRSAYLNKHPLCEACAQQGRVTAAQEVHHRTPVENAASLAGMEQLMYDPGNLQALCHNCHIEAHMVMGRGGSKRRNESKTQAALAEHLKRFS